MENDTKFELDTTLAFDSNKQAAIMGHCLRDKMFCKQCSFAVKKEWFTSPTVGRLYETIMNLYREFSKVPTPEEIVTYRPFTQEDAHTQRRLKETLVDAMQKTERYSLSILRSEMDEWIQAVTYAQMIQQAVPLYNAKKVKAAWEVIDRAASFRSSASFEAGYNQGFLSAEERVDTEEEERVRQSTQILSYGNGFLDDALGGIVPNDLIVLGAATGAGKSQLATSIALHNAQQGGLDGKGVPVHYFALEAENYEIERRIKYGIISAEYYADGEEGKPYISYGDWRMNKCESLLGPIEKRLEPKIRDAVRNLKTLYRTSGDFNLQALERHLLEIVTESKLIVIDHLHYVDTEGDDENRAYKKVVKLIRDVVLHYSVPVILVAHLRKQQGGRKDASLMPTINDFHGTSDVPKISTTCIMLAPAHDHAAAHPWQFPTYLGAVKSRLDGSRTRYAGLTQFDARTSRYEHAYRISKMNDLLQGEFSDLSSKSLPRWANPIVMDDIKTPGMG